MAFSSLPLYHLDPPNSNSWNQHNQQTTILHINEPPAHLISPPPISSQPPSSSAEGAGGGGSKPGSMTERARLAKIPLPESALKCPRCDSTNTKFCYFNNYSLSQPRHFCKTCRRYWTRGGALRNVPVGGGCRRNNKRVSSNKQSSSKNSSSAAAAAAASSCSTATSGSTVIPSNYAPMNPNHLSFLSSLADQYSAGLNFTSLQPINTGDYGSGSGIGLMDQWRIQQSQQLPFLGGNYGNFDGGDKVASSTALGLISQLESVKMEESHQPLMQSAGLSLPRQYLGMAPAGADVYIGGGGWAGDHHLSGFNFSSPPRNLSYGQH